jgi:hypothetical protein
MFRRCEPADIYKYFPDGALILTLEVFDTHDTPCSRS